jgi:hypothetical protein
MATKPLHLTPNRSILRVLWGAKPTAAIPRTLQPISAEKELETAEEAEDGLFTRLAAYREQRGNVGFSLPFSL